MRLGWRVRSNAKRASVWVVVATVLAIIAALLWAGTPFHGSDRSVASVLDDDAIDVEQIDGGYVLSPADAYSDRALVFYPGARVAPDAYLASLAPLVRETDTTVVVVDMPLNLAILDQGAADRVLDRRPDVDEWYVGGHSLGGAMACRYARANPDRLDSLVLLGSYCDRSIADTDLRTLVVTGAGDTVIDTDAFERNRDNLPGSATVRELPGVNHTQFGSYTGQPGDTPTGTSYATAHRRLTDVLVPWLAASPLAV